MANSLRSRPAKASYSCHSRSVTWLTAVRLSTLAPRVALSNTLGEQLVELLACPLRGRYSHLHGDASSCRRRQPAIFGLHAKQECIPVSFSSKYRTSPSRLKPIRSGCV